MPVYDYKCSVCGTISEEFVKIADLKLPINCHKCIGSMERQVSSPMVIGDITPYTCPITGTLISSRSSHRENLKKHNCRVLEPGENEGYKRSLKVQEEKEEKAIEATVEEFIEKLPTNKRELLAQEVSAGADVNVIKT